MENCTTKSLMVASVDMPLIERSHLAWLIERLGDFLGAMLSHEDKIEPLPIALSMNALHKIRDRLAKKQASLRALASIDGFRLISAPDDWPQAIWTNLNRPEDLDRLGR
jgi:molybdopterin-guanine dinucleotide biosynthesis protein A